MTLNGVPPFALHQEAVWLDSHKYNEAERQFHELSSKQCSSSCGSDLASTKSTIASEIANARQRIKNLMNSKSDLSSVDCSSLIGRIERIEKENREMKENFAVLNQKFQELLLQVKKSQSAGSATKQADSPKKVETVSNGPAAADDDDVDLFGSDEETEEEARLKEERLKAYADKKSKKPALVAKSSVVLDVKPWDDETDMKELEKAVRSIQLDGLVWGAGKLVPLAYGINKFQLVAIVEDEKVSIDLLQEKIESFEDLVQSVDVAAFNKL